MDGRLAGALLMGATLALAPPARAEPERVAIADDATDDDAVVRLRAELAAAGFAVVEVQAWPASATPSDVGQRLESAGVVAAVRVVDGAAEVWLVDRRRRTTSLREVVTSANGSGAEDATISIRTVETVRAELRGASHRRARGLPTAFDTGSAPEADAGEEHPPFAVHLGFGVSVAPGGIPATPTFTAGARWMPVPRFGIAALAVASPFHATVEGVEGTTSVWTGLAGAGVAIEPTEPGSEWGVVFEVGGAGGWLHLDGASAPGFVDRSETLAVGAPYLRPSVRWRFAPPLALCLDVFGAVAFPKPVVAFAGREVASWGRPVVASSLGLEIAP